MIGACWCGPSYFFDPDAFGRIVSSGGSTVNVWKVQWNAQGTPPATVLTNLGSSVSIEGRQDGGFFTSVSGGLVPTIWAVSRPPNVTLFAFRADPPGVRVPTLFQEAAGTWPNTGGNANIVPVVANGKVYVASYKTAQHFRTVSVLVRRMRSCPGSCPSVCTERSNSAESFDPRSLPQGSIRTGRANHNQNANRPAGEGRRFFSHAESSQYHPRGRTRR
jgi:hypothetical protein